MMSFIVVFPQAKLTAAPQKKWLFYLTDKELGVSRSVRLNVLGGAWVFGALSTEVSHG